MLARTLTLATAFLLLLTGCGRGPGTGLPVVAPAILEIRPGDASEQVSPDAHIVIRFADVVPDAWVEYRRVRFDPPVGCDFRWHPEGHTLTCEPYLPLAFDTTYTLVVDDVAPTSTTLRSSALASQSSSQTVTFSTHASDATFESPVIVASEPGDGVWDVRSTFKTVNLAFSEPMFVPSVETALEADVIHVTPSDGTAATRFGCDTFAWNDDLTQVRCQFASDVLGHYVLRVDETLMGANGKTVTSPSDVHWVVVEAPSVFETTWTGTYVDSRKGTFTMTASFERRDTGAPIRVWLAFGGVTAFAFGPTPPFVGYEPDPVRLGGTVSGEFSNGAGGGGTLNVSGRIQNGAWTGSMHRSIGGFAPPQFWGGAFTLEPSDTYVPLDPFDSIEDGFDSPRSPPPHEPPG